MATAKSKVESLVLDVILESLFADDLTVEESEELAKEITERLTEECDDIYEDDDGEPVNHGEARDDDNVPE